MSNLLKNIGDLVFCSGEWDDMEFDFLLRNHIII